jgi:hypothetical protein
MNDGSVLEQTICEGQVVQEYQTAKPKAYIQNLGDIIQHVAQYPVQSIAQEDEPKQYPMNTAPRTPVACGGTLTASSGRSRSRSRWDMLARRSTAKARSTTATTPRRHTAESGQA